MRLEKRSFINFNFCARGEKIRKFVIIYAHSFQASINFTQNTVKIVFLILIFQGIKFLVAQKSPQSRVSNTSQIYRKCIQKKWSNFFYNPSSYCVWLFINAQNNWDIVQISFPLFGIRWFLVLAITLRNPRDELKIAPYATSIDQNTHSVYIWM